MSEGAESRNAPHYLGHRDRLRARFLYHVLLATRSTLSPRTPPGG